MSLSIWVVYNHPSDQPDVFVAREMICSAMKVQPGEMFTAPTIDELRSLLPQGLHRMLPMKGDDPVIIETWL